MVRRASETVIAEQFARISESIIIVAGIPFARRGTTNNLRVVQLQFEGLKN